MTPGAAAVSEREEFVSPGPFGGGDEEEGNFGVLVAADGGPEAMKAGSTRALTGVVKPAFGSEGGEFSCIRGWGHLPPGADAADFRFGGEGELNGPEFSRRFDVEDNWLHRERRWWNSITACSIPDWEVEPRNKVLNEAEAPC